MPTVVPRASLAVVSALFQQDPALSLVVVAADGGRRPLGLIPRAACLERLAASSPGGGTAQELAQRDVPILDAGLMLDEALAVLAAEGGDAWSTHGIIVTKYDLYLGVVPAPRISHWLAERMARMRADRDAARRALAQATEQRLFFLANMGHELRTPLNAIIGYADMMQSQAHGPLAPERYRDYVDAMHGAGVHLLNIINAILDLAKIDAKSMRLHEEKVALSTLVDGALTMIHSLAEDKGVRLVARLRPDLPKVFVDEQIVRQILLNLLSNAVKFSPPKAKVTVAGEIGRRGTVRLVVQDQGPGIRPEDIEKIMQPFKQVEDAGAPRKLGTGLGLSLVKAFAELHDGNFQLLSSTGKGTRAVVTLPASRVCRDKPGGQGEFIFTRPSLHA
ncbi:MAG: ATP-binding protein [Pseudomonadota bacterium]